MCRTLLEAVDVSYVYPGAEASGPALSAAGLAIAGGQSVALVGPSGAGKTTLLYCLAGVVVPTAGAVLLEGRRIDTLDGDRRASLRLNRFGFVFQFAELVPELTLRENVELPLRLLRRGSSVRRRADTLLERLGIGQVADRRPAQVSGGQAQRCAVARAVVHEPAIVFADEPTGALDTAAGALALGELRRLSWECGAALVVVTHDTQVAAQLDRQVVVTDGRCR